MNINKLKQAIGVILIAISMLRCVTIYASESFLFQKNVSTFSVSKEWQYLLDIEKPLECTQKLLNRNYTSLSQKLGESHFFWDAVNWSAEIQALHVEDFFLANPERTVAETISHFKSIKWKFKSDLERNISEKDMNPALVNFIERAIVKLEEPFLAIYLRQYNALKNKDFIYSSEYQDEVRSLQRDLKKEVLLLKGLIGELLVSATIKEIDFIGKHIGEILGEDKKAFLEMDLRTKKVYDAIINLEIDIVHGNGLRWLEVKNYKRQFSSDEISKLNRRHQLLRLTSDVLVSYGFEPLVLEYVFINKGTTKELINGLTKQGAHIYLPE